MTTFLAFVFVLGILVFVHEFGHFIVAKWVGVKVHVFSIGFGPRLFGFRRGDTDYRVSVIPLGGYVRMAGENPTDTVTGSPDEFNSRSVPERMAILLAGPLMNLIFAVVFFAMIYGMGTEEPLYLRQAATVGWVVPNSPADSAGVRPGDRIVAVMGKDASTWRDVISLLATAPSGHYALTIQHDGERLQAVFPPGDSGLGRDEGFWGMIPPWRYQIISVLPNSAAERAGLQPGDRIVEIDGEPVRVWSQVQTAIEASPGQPISLTIVRRDERLSLTVVPEREEQSGVGRIGIRSREETVEVRYGIAEALTKSLEDNVKYAGLLFTYLGRVFSGKESGREIGSVLTIAVEAGRAAEIGWDAMLFLMGVLSLQLGILNLLPIPILDGGNLMMLIVEGISGKPISVKGRGIAQAIGLVILLGILAFALSNDVSRHFLNK